MVPRRRADRGHGRRDRQLPARRVRAGAGGAGDGGAARGGDRGGGSGGARSPVTAFAESLDRITVAELRRRGGLKWTYAGPDVLGAFVAEMDFGTAPEVDAALREVIARQDFGYLPPAAAQRMAEACAAWLAERHGWAGHPDRIRPRAEVFKGRGGAIPLFPRPGSPVILPTPAYMPFLSVPPLLGREIIQVPMTAAGDRPVLDTGGIDAAFRAATCSSCATPATRWAACTPRPSWPGSARSSSGTGGGCSPTRSTRRSPTPGSVTSRMPR